jgi:CBS domain containing-hemolysin-like protein
VDQLDEYLSATQLGITIVSLALGWIGEDAFAELLSSAFPAVLPRVGHAHHIVASGISFFMITLLHVVVGELVPKSMAIQNAENIVLKISPPLRLFYRISYPLIWAFTSLANFILKLLGYHGLEEDALSEQELKLVMKESREEGVITENEAQIISKAFEFSDKRARDIMTSAENVIFLSLKKSFEQNISTIRNSLHTRIPLCREGFESVIGVVNVKDLWPYLFNTRSNEVFLKASRPALYAEPTVRQDRLMKTFQARKAHFAVVRDLATNKNLGIVTLEDVLEELVGEISDEHDV